MFSQNKTNTKNAIIPQEKIDARIGAIMVNIDSKIDPKIVDENYGATAKKIQEQEQVYKKSYDTLKSTVQESYFTGSLKYGKNFVV